MEKAHSLSEPGKPLKVEGLRVRPEWIDYNGHLNVAYYIKAFDLAVDCFFDDIGLTENYRMVSGRSIFSVESHVMWISELLANDPIAVEIQVLGFDEKRIHSFHRMYHAETGAISATAEWMQLSVDLTKRRAAPFEACILNGIEALADKHESLPHPPEVGRVLTLNRAR